MQDIIESACMHRYIFARRDTYKAHIPLSHALYIYMLVYIYIYIYIFTLQWKMVLKWLVTYTNVYTYT